jgi:hypothetical protein
MENYVGQREQFVGNCGPQNEGKKCDWSCECVQTLFHSRADSSNHAWNKSPCTAMHKFYEPSCTISIQHEKLQKILPQHSIDWEFKCPHSEGLKNAAFSVTFE